MTEMIKEFPNYHIGRCGNILNKSTNKFLNPKPRKCGYKSVTLYNNGAKKSFLVHRLVALVYNPNPNNLEEVNHIDEDKLNNHAANLEWMTPQQNTEHSVAKTYSFINPQGEVISIFNMLKFCREHNLNNAHMISVTKGTRNHHKQWRFNGSNQSNKLKS